MFAEFYETEAQARVALGQWAGKVRLDWTVTPAREILRSNGGSWTPDSLAPAQRAQAQGRDLRKMRMEAHGPFARWGEESRGTAEASIEVCWPKETSSSPYVWVEV